MVSRLSWSGDRRRKRHVGPGHTQGSVLANSWGGGFERAATSGSEPGARRLLTSSKWAKLAKCSQDTALRDITDLVERGILGRDEAGGRSTSYSIIEEA